MERMRKVIAMAAAVLTVAGLLPAPVFAAEAEQWTPETVLEEEALQAAEETEETAEEILLEDVAGETIWTEEELPDNEELFDAYVERLFFGGISTFGESARAYLSPLDQKLYDCLKAQICRIAAGEVSSSIVTVEQQELAAMGAQLDYTATDIDQAAKAFRAQFDLRGILDALLHDCPYEMYWYAKSKGMYSTVSASYRANDYTISKFKFVFAVAENYQAAGSTEQAPLVDTSQAGRVNSALRTAQSIVAKHRGKSDYEILKAYKDDICALVDYNTAAAKPSWDPYVQGDPWQLVYVFDGDSKTNVVCEGYAKAFQYLCDLTDFYGNVACTTVTGVMSDTRNSGGHMWNIVTYGGKNYLADITNSDLGSAGQDGSLFMAGAPGSIAEGYTFGRIHYDYSDQQIKFWGSGNGSVLRLADRACDPGAGVCTQHKETTVPGTAATCTEAGVTEGRVCSICGKILVKQEEVPAKGHTSVTDAAKAATCTETGLTEGARCSVCGTILKKQETVPAKGHTSVTDAAKAATCTETGLTEGSHCSVCGATLKKQETVPAKGHSYSSDLDDTCDVCGGKREVKIVTVPMYRLYNPNSGEHFYTGSAVERDSLKNAGWNYEGVSWNAPVSGGYPIYRMFNPNNGDHHYTASMVEVENLKKAGWKYEGVAWNSATKENVPLFRLYDPNADCGSHHYTSSDAEMATLISLGWRYEGVGWYGMAK